jgi:hypothetical protein
VVFDENGRLMIEALGETPERLLKQKNGNFAIRAWPQAPVTFVMHDQNALTLHLTNSGLILAGERVGPADPQTFHSYGAVTPSTSTAATARAREWRQFQREMIDRLLITTPRPFAAPVLSPEPPQQDCFLFEIGQLALPGFGWNGISPKAYQRLIVRGVTESPSPPPGTGQHRISQASGRGRG